MNILINSNIESVKWKELLIKSRFASPFQSQEFYNFYNNINGYSAEVFAIEEKRDLKALIVVTINKEKGFKSYFSKRGIIYGGPLVQENEQNSLLLLLNFVSQHYKRKLIYLEIRNNFSFEALNDSFLNSGWAYKEHLNVQLRLEEKSFEDVFALMTYNRRREIKLSLKEGASVAESNEKNDVIEFYKILKNLYSTRVKLPLPNIEYFLKGSICSISKAFIVKHKENVIGGAFCVTDLSNSINTLYYAGHRDYHKKIFPTHLAIIGVIDYAIKNHIKMVDFMGAGKPNVPYGVRDFKMQFGGELVEHGRYLKVLNPVLYKVGILGLKILSKIKK